MNFFFFTAQFRKKIKLTYLGRKPRYDKTAAASAKMKYVKKKGGNLAFSIQISL